MVHTASLDRSHGGRERARIAVALGVVLTLAATLRLYRIADWPVFIDEDGYTQVVLDMTHLPLTKAFGHSLFVGKPPLNFILQAGLAMVIPDAVVAGRLISAAAGVVSCGLVFMLGDRLGGRTAGLLAALLYASAPLAVLHERMAIQDGLLTATCLAAVLLAWSSVRQASWRIATLSAIVSLAAVATKVPAVGLVVPILALSFVEPAALGRKRLLILVASAPAVCYLALRLSPAGPSIAVQDSEHLQPLRALLPNTLALGDTSLTYLGPQGLTLLLASLAIMGVTAIRKALFLGTCIIVWVVPWLVLGDFSPSRYYLPAMPYVCVAVAVGISLSTRLVSRRRAAPLALGLATLLVIPWAVSSALAAQDLRLATLSAIDDWQYRSGWPSGYGYGEAADYVADISRAGNGVAYAVIDGHYYAAALRHPPPTGVAVLGKLQPDAPLPTGGPVPLYLLVDDPPDGPPEARADSLMRLNPDRDLTVLVAFGRVYVLRSERPQSSATP